MYEALSLLASFDASFFFLVQQLCRLCGLQERAQEISRRAPRYSAIFHDYTYLSWRPLGSGMVIYLHFIYVCVRLCVCVCVCVCARARICMYVYVYVHTCTYMHIYIHTHTHTQLARALKPYTVRLYMCMYIHICHVSIMKACHSTN